MYKRILVPLDGSLRAERALPLAADLARAGSGEVILASVVTEPTYLRREEDQPPTAEAVLAGERETAMRSLEDVSQRLELAGVTTQMEVRVAPTVAPALLDIIQTVHADLVIMCSHGRTGFQRWTPGQRCTEDRASSNRPDACAARRWAGPHERHWRWTALSVRARATRRLF